MHSTPSLAKWAAAISMIAVAAVCLTACGAAVDLRAAADTSPTSKATPAAHRAALVACLKQHGVTLPAKPALAFHPGTRKSNSKGFPLFRQLFRSHSTTARKGSAPLNGLFHSKPAQRFNAKTAPWFNAKTAPRFNTKTAAAFKACASKAGFQPNSAQVTKTAKAAMARLSSLVACLKQHGVTVPTPGAGGAFRPGLSHARRLPAISSKTITALKACAGKSGFPAMGFARGFGFGFAFRGHFGAQGKFSAHPARTVIDAFATCVRKHGYNLPAPNLSGKGPVFPQAIRANKKFEAAAKSCATVLRPSFRSNTARAPNQGGAFQVNPGGPMQPPAASAPAPPATAQA